MEWRSGGTPTLCHSVEDTWTEYHSVKHTWTECYGVKDTWTAPRCGFYQRWCGHAERFWRLGIHVPASPPQIARTWASSLRSHRRVGTDHADRHRP
eukprot:365910-Chlamydomonas_euryale.AAC.38